MSFFRLALYLAVILTGLPAPALDYPWGILVPENDARDREMREYDEADTANMIAVINGSEKPFHHHILSRRIPIKDLLSARTAFCELHFDAVRPLVLTPNEKNILQEYLKRGGFILFYIDAYPYTQDEFWKIKEWPLIDFLKQELPAADANFVAGHATDDFPIFGIHYKTETADAIRHELLGNPTPRTGRSYFIKGACAALSWGNTATSKMIPGFPSPGRSHSSALTWTPKAIA